MNKGIIVGRLTQKPELRYTNYNKAVSQFTLATEVSKDETLFLRLSVFGRIAETLVEYCDKGDLIGAEYVIKNHDYEDKNGNKRYEYSFIANTIKFLATNRNNTKKEQTTENEPLKQENDPYAEFGEQVSLDDNFLD